MKDTDCLVVGASFAGLACATVMARSGLRVRVVERKSDVGEKLHTTGIIVKDAVDEVALLDGLPVELARRIPGVRLYAPCMQFVDLFAPGYYFLATDTPGVMRWLASQAQRAGAEILCSTAFRGARREEDGFDVGDLGRTRFLVGADGPGSTVARVFGLGRSAHFLFGLEHEYPGVALRHPDRLHCFVDRRLAPGYIGWVVAGPGGIQVGIAHRLRGRRRPAVDAIREFLVKITPVVDLRGIRPGAVRAGMIPCGGTVSPVAAPRVLLVGDAAGMVSPVTAGGIHMALKHGMAAGEAISAFLAGSRADPCAGFADSYPRFRVKRALRFLYDRFQSDWLFNLLLKTRLVRGAAGVVYFHRKGVFDADGGDERGACSGGTRRPEPKR